MTAPTWRERLLDASSDLLTVHEVDGTVRFANAAAERLLGLAPEDLVGSNPFRLVHPDDRDPLIDAMLRMVDQPAGSHAFLIRVRHRDGSWRMLEAVARNQLADDDVAGVVVSSRDVTARVEVEQRLRLYLESSAQGVLGLDEEARLTFLNPAAARILGVDPDAVLGQVGHELFHHSRPDGSPYPMADCPCVAAARGGSRIAGHAETFWRSDGTPVPVDFQVTPLENSWHDGAVLTFLDVSDQVRAEQQVTDQAVLMRAVLDALPAQTAVVDATGTIIEVNRAWSAFSDAFGGSPETTGVGVSFLDVCDAVTGREREQAAAAAATVRGVLEGRLADTTQDITCNPDDRPPLYFSFQVVPLPGMSGAVLSYTDVTARKSLEVQAAYRAMHDELTGLPNRALLLDRIEHALLERSHDDLAVLFIDLDHFKLVNDGYGHAAGDEVLRELGRRLQAAVRPSDTVARLAGDEFVVLCERLPFITEAYRLAQRVLASVSEPFEVSGSQVSLGASVGVAAAESDVRTAGELLQAADRAMFEAKSRGRNQFALYDDGVHHRSTRRVAQALALRRLVEDDRLTVHYQPMVDLRDGRMTGVEALLRWQAGPDAPDAALSVALAEETGLIGDLGQRVLRRALTQAADFRLPDGSLLPLSVNLAAQQLDALLVPMVVDAAEDASYPLDALTLELTERSVMIDVATSVQVLRELRALGVQIAVDDFGVGYSSLAYLRDLPLDSLKIDRDFVRSLSAAPRDDLILSAIIQLGAALDLRVVAEGIESEEQRTRLLMLGCTVGQGYLFGAAQPADAIRSRS